jgi:type IV secretory pathway component VirB8
MSTDVKGTEHKQAAEADKTISTRSHTAFRVFYLVTAFVVVAGLLLAGWLPRRQRAKEVNARAEEQKTTLPVVQVMTVHKASDLRQRPRP